MNPTLYPETSNTVLPDAPRPQGPALYEELRWLARASAVAALNTGQDVHLWQAQAFAKALRLVLQDAHRSGQIEASELDDGIDALVAALHPKILAARRAQLARQFPALFKGDAGECPHQAVNAPCCDPLPASPGLAPGLAASLANAGLCPADPQKPQAWLTSRLFDQGSAPLSQ